MSVAVALLVWLAAGYRVLLLLRHPNFLNTMYASIFVFAAAAFTAKVLETQIDAAVGPHVGDLIKHLLVVAMGASIQLYILAVDSGRPLGRNVMFRVGVAVAVAVAMVATFVAAPIHTASASGELDQMYLDCPRSWPID